MGFCSCTIKFILIVFNLACALCGLGILILGIVSNSNGGSFKSLLSGQVTTASVCFMVLGSIIFLIAFFGCCGALREDSCFIQTYAVILLALLIIEIAIGVTAFIFKNKVDDELKHNFEGYFSNYRKNQREIDDIQHSLQCCGYDGPEFWHTLSPPLPIPSSCCKDQRDCNNQNSFQDGCLRVTRNYLKKLFYTIGGVAIGIAGVELIAVIFAFYVAHSIKRAALRGYV